MFRLEEENIEEERILEDVVKNSTESVEKGLKFLERQVPAGAVKIDILAVDASGTLCVLELKVAEDDRSLVQGLQYVEWVGQSADRLANFYYKEPEVKIDPSKTPRLILVAPSFSAALISAVKYVDRGLCPVELKQYHYLKEQGGQHSLWCEDVEVGVPPTPEETYTLEYYYNYIKDEAVRTECMKFVKSVQSIGNGIEPKATQSWYVGLQFQGRNIATFSPRQKAFYVQWKDETGEWSEQKIEKKDDLRPSIIDQIRQTYKKLGGQVQY